MAMMLEFEKKYYPFITLENIEGAIKNGQSREIGAKGSPIVE
jgi:hypothetical protein